MDSRYLQGNFGPVDSEITEVDLPVTGTLPDFLDGRYLRNGPNPVSAVDPATYHWFMGSGMVHGLRIRDGRAEWYRNRWVRSADVAAALGDASPTGPRHAGMDFAANTHVVGHAGKTLALVEGGFRPYELDDELSTLGPCDFDGTLPGGYTAHPIRDPATGELHAISYYWGWGNRVQYSVLGIDGRIRHTVDIRVGQSPMMHAFSLTEKYVVVFDLPVTLDLRRASAVPPPPGVSHLIRRRGMPKGLARLANRGAVRNFPYTWNPRYRARVGVLPREGTAADVRWFDVDPCYVFHPVNAYDDDDRIVLDVVRHPKMFATDLLGPNEGPPTLDRWTIDLTAGKVLEDRLDDQGQEFPRIDERRAGRRHRFGYVVSGLLGDAFHSVVKHDLAGGATSRMDFGSARAADEFVFVPRATDGAEDDGALMGFVYDRASDRSDLVVLDAGSMEQVAAVHLPARVPHGFHGSWIPSGDNPSVA